MESNKPILVTGSPRSGTSWVGRILSQGSFLRYVHEPFNVDGRPCSCGVQFKYWFHYLPPHDHRFFYSHLKHTIFPSFNRFTFANVITEITQTKRIRPLSKYLQSYPSRRVLVKDPLAIFSAETLADLFGMDVIVLIRHPAAVVHSYKALNWTHSFSHFLNQKDLMEEHLFPFQNEMEDFAKQDYDIIDQISLLWKLIHYMIVKFQKTNPGWVFVRYEDLAAEPINGFREISERISLPISRHTQAVIQAHSLRNPQSSATIPYSLKKHRNQVVSQWKKSLTSKEIFRIQKRVESISCVFYSDQEWQS